MAFNYSPRVITDSLVLYLDAANQNSYPGTGTVWSDLSRSGNNGTLTNGPTFNAGNGGNIVFDGTNDNVLLPNIGTDLGKTYLIWIKNTSSDATLRLAYAHRDPDRVYIGVNGTDSYLRIGTDAGNISGTTLTIGVWFYLGIRINSSTQYEGFVNGASVGVRSTTLASSTGTGLGAYINDNVAASNYWKGDIAQTSIYNRALSASEILQNYNATKGRYL